MINLRTKREKKRWQIKLVYLSLEKEKKLFKKIRPILGRQYLDISRLLEWGIENVNCAIDDQFIRMQKSFFVSSIKIGDFFQNMVYNLLAEMDVQNLTFRSSFKKQFKERTFPWYSNFSNYITKKVNNTTRRRIKQFIDQKKSDGLTYKEIAKELRKLKRNKRTDSIVRTFTHSIIEYSINEALDIYGYDYSEWISSKNEKNKRQKFNHGNANGERVAMGNIFKRTGEELAFPGDPNGSIGNIAHCRCTRCFYITLSNDRR